MHELGAASWADLLASTYSRGIYVSTHFAGYHSLYIGAGLGSFCACMKVELYLANSCFQTQLTHL